MLHSVLHLLLFINLLFPLKELHHEALQNEPLQIPERFLPQSRESSQKFPWCTDARWHSPLSDALLSPETGLPLPGDGEAPGIVQPD